MSNESEAPTRRARWESQPAVANPNSVRNRLARRGDEMVTKIMESYPVRSAGFRG
jgi:ribosomal 50S subunit-associated protein YjgA (DUF615 family)